MANKKDFSKAFGFDSSNNTQNEDQNLDNSTNVTSKETQKNEIINHSSSSAIQNKHESSNNLVVTYNNPMKILAEKYDSILKTIQEEESDILKGFKKREPQSKINCNPTIQVRRDIYEILNDYIKDSNLGKTKVLNEIFNLGIGEFIKKYNKD